MNLEWTLLALRLLAVAVLYAFLAAIVYVIWRDLRTASYDPTQDTQVFAAPDQIAALAARLRVVGVGETALKSGDVFALWTHTSVGRAPDNQIVLPDTYVSSYHARLDRRDDEWWLTDLGSRNGTRLNDVTITKSVPLVRGDVIGIGQVELKLEIED